MFFCDWAGGKNKPPSPILHLLVLLVLVLQLLTVLVRMLVLQSSLGGACASNRTSDGSSNTRSTAGNNGW